MLTRRAAGDECGIVADGQIGDFFFCIEDATTDGKPEVWARAAIELYDRLGADAIVAERNFGGDMVESTITNEAELMFLRGERKTKRVNVYCVTSSRGKVLRAEPFVSSYINGLVRHVGYLPHLEEEMTQFKRDWDRARDGSPNRLDAHIFALTELDTPKEAPPARPNFTMRVGS